MLIIMTVLAVFGALWLLWMVVVAVRGIAMFREDRRRDQEMQALSHRSSKPKKKRNEGFPLVG